MKTPASSPGTALNRAPRPRGHLAQALKSTPNLAEAYRQALKRLSKVPGICGIGIGRRYLESQGRYAATSSAQADYCLKIYVRKKRKHVPRTQRIPRWIFVKPRGTRRRVRVEIDVVAALGRAAKPGKLEGSRGAPTAGRIDAGHLFACTDQAVANPLPENFSTGDAELGTIGALVETSDGGLHAVSASHVFIQLCDGIVRAPSEDRALCVSASRWELLPEGSFRPLNIEMNQCLRDALAFSVPQNIQSVRPHWPDGFTGELATGDDIERAVFARTPCGFIWVERRGLHRPIMVPVDLEAMVDPMLVPVDCGGIEKSLPFVQVWPLRFMPDTNRVEEDRSTEPGDSGAGVFLWGENNTDCRLLGFHFYRSADRTLSYATDAKWFLHQAFGDGFGKSFHFKI